MADEIDIAQERIDADLAAAIASRTIYHGISATECECGEEIPEGRREAVKGVKLCIDCAAKQAIKAQGVRRV